MMLQALKHALVYGLEILHPRVNDNVLGRATIKLDYVTYQGIVLSSGVNQYLGIRYAAPPLRDLRYRAPLDPPISNVTLNATHPICLGISAGTPSSESEDCLFMNVWTPSNATSTSRLPVWFFIQGGGYTLNANANYNGSTVVAASGRNIVLVNFNYRVGPWGFLASEKVRANGDLNAGLLDQRKALEWVQKYISAFGGDPTHVVIHGDSAGGGSVALHMAAYGGRDDGLFVGGIGESVFFPTVPNVCELEWQFDLYVRNVGCNGTYDELQCLRDSSVADSQAANVPSPYPRQSQAPLFFWSPTVDGDFLVDHPYLLFERGDFVKVPLIIGDDTNEGTIFAANASTPTEVSDFFSANFPHLTYKDTASINMQYPLNSALPSHAAYFPSAASGYGDAVFTCPGLLLSSLISRLLSPCKVWNYRYNVAIESNIIAGLGIPHVEELPAIFGPGNVQDGDGGSYVTYNEEVVGVTMGYYMSFVRSLDPNAWRAENAVWWEGYGEGMRGENHNIGRRRRKCDHGMAIETGRRLLIQTNGTVMEEVPEDQVERCRFWRGLVVKMEQ